MKTKKPKCKISLSVTTLLVFLTLFLNSCSNENKPTIDPYHPERPKDIPYTTCSGDTIEWNWKKQRAYNEKKLFLVRDSTGCVIAVVIKIK